MKFTATHPEFGECTCGDHQWQQMQAAGWTRADDTTKKPQKKLSDIITHKRALADCRAAGIKTCFDLINAARTEKGRATLLAVWGINERNIEGIIKAAKE